MSDNIENNEESEVSAPVVDDSVPLDGFLIDDFPPRVSGKEDLNMLLQKMVNQGGSDIFIMSGMEVWMSIFGRKRRLTRRRLGHSEVMAMLVDIYGANAQAQMGRVEPIDTSYEFKPDRATRYRFRVNAVGSTRDGGDAVTITLRSIPTTPPSAQDLGIEQDIIHTCDITDQGMILVVGATGNGKSTVLASILRDQMEKSQGNRNFVTIEAPVEFVYDAVEKPTSFTTQIEVGRHIKSFSDGVVNALRMAPNVILIGESRDYETVSSAVEASKTGHTVYSTVHSNNVAETLRRLVAVYPEDLQGFAQFDIVDSMTMIIAQRLVPSVDGKRVALREYLKFDTRVKDVLRKAPNLTLAAYDMVNRYGRSMVSDAEDKFKEGRISLEVIDRIKANYDAALKAEA